MTHADLIWFMNTPFCRGAATAVLPVVAADLTALFKAPGIDEDGWARFKHFNWRTASFAYVRGLLLGGLGGVGLGYLIGG